MTESVEMSESVEISESAHMRSGAAVMARGELTALVRTHRVMAIIRGDSAPAALDTGRVLLEAGVALVEVTLTTPGALDTIASLRALAPAGARVGAGTVLTARDVDDVFAAGAQFVVTPAVTEAVSACARREIPCAAGAFTASEAYTAHSAGAEIIKLFPASSLGPDYLKALRDPLPQIPFMAVGGVDLAVATGFLAAGAIGVGVGGPLVGDAARGGSLTDLARRAQEFVAWAEQCGPSTP